MTSRLPIAVFGPTTWGTTLAILLARKGLPVVLVTRSEAEQETLVQARENPTRLPGVKFPDTLKIECRADLALARSRMLLLAVPSHTLRDNLKLIRPHLHDELLIVNAGKGLESGTNKRMSEVIEEELPKDRTDGICVLSGPNLAAEIAAGLPASAVVASRSELAAEGAQQVFMCSSFRVYTSGDVVGVELGGALKNVIALGAGICDGLDYGDNAKASLITRGLAEMSRLGLAMGANLLTFAGLAGLGDLIATCSSRLSRNHRLGEQLALGRSLPEALASMHHVVEGVNTTVAARELAMRLGVDMPIVLQMHRVLFEGLDPRRAVIELMCRDPKKEIAGLEAMSVD